MIVIDLGCAELGHDSVGQLIDRFHPELLLGFDPWPEMDEGVFDREGTVVVLRKMAAWTEVGDIGYVKDWWASRVTEDGDGELDVPCFDLIALLDVLPRPVVLKMNVEGAEYPLLRYLAEYGMDTTLDRCLVQWHDSERIKLACPQEEYP